MGDEEESNLPPSGQPSRRAAAGTVLQGVQKSALPVASQGLRPLTEAVHP